MNFLELTKATRIICGIQGTGPSTVEDAQGLEELLVTFVKDAVIDIESLKPDFDFMRNTQSFSTIASQRIYIHLDIFVTTTPDFTSYITTTFTYTDSNGKKSLLKQIDYERLLLLDEDTEGSPSFYAIRPSDNALIIHPTPDNPYTIEFDYYRAPQTLVNDTDTPLIPLAHHQLIVYKAVEKMSIYLVAPELYKAYSTEANKMLGQLMRQERRPTRWQGRPITGRRRRYF